MYSAPAAANHFMTRKTMISITAQTASELFTTYQDVSTPEARGRMHPCLAPRMTKQGLKKIFHQDITINLRKVTRNVVMDVTLPNDDWLDGQRMTAKISDMNLYRQLESLVKSSKAKRAWQAALRLIELDLDTPLPLGYMERFKGPFIRKTAYFTKTLEDGQSVKVWFWDATRTEAERQQMLVSVASYCRRMHDHGITHNDLHLSNFMVSRSDEGLQLSCIDLNRCRYQRRLAPWQRCLDLSRLHWKEYLPQFLTVYCGSDLSLQSWWWVARWARTIRKKRRQLKKR
jgi:hypothetical protein